MFKAFFSRIEEHGRRTKFGFRIRTRLKMRGLLIAIDKDKRPPTEWPLMATVPPGCSFLNCSARAPTASQKSSHANISKGMSVMLSLLETTVEVVSWLE